MAFEFMEARGVAGVSLGVKLRDAHRVAVSVVTVRLMAMGVVVTGALASVDVNVIMGVTVVGYEHAAIVIAC